MKKSSIILMGIIMLVVVNMITACDSKKEKIEKKGKKMDYDYLVLVNKYSKIPDDWEKNIKLVGAKNAWNKSIKLEKQTYKKYKQLEKSLEGEGINIELDSGYRSVKEQQEILNKWSKDPKKGIKYANKYAAVPEYSEHNTGLAVDIVIRKNGKLIEENEDMIAEKEILAKIHKKLATYGFILRYPEGRDDITGYTYEPWHLRYVGSKEIAKEIMNKDITLEEYLGSIKDIKETHEAAKYKIEKTLQDYFVDVYGEKISDSRFNVTKIYSSDEERKEPIKSLELGEKDVAFEVTYQLKPSDGTDPNELIIVDGEYDKKIGWVKNIGRLGVLKYNEENNSYSITNFGTGW